MTERTHTVPRGVEQAESANAHTYLLAACRAALERCERDITSKWKRFQDGSDGLALDHDDLCKQLRAAIDKSVRTQQ